MSQSEVILNVMQLSVRRGARTVIDKLNLQVRRGEVVAVFGSNGCGKSTLLMAIAGIHAPSHGQVSVTVDDLPADVWGSSASQRVARQHVGYVPENADPPGFLTGAELTALAATCRGTSLLAQQSNPAWQQTVALLGLDQLFDLRIEHMSLGQRRRSCIAAALIGAPPLLVFDEPDNGLDAARLTSMILLLNQHLARGGGAVLATHDAGFADAINARRVELGQEATKATSNL